MKRPMAPAAKGSRNSRRSARQGLAGAPRAPRPHGIRPMLATLVDEPFDRAGWFFEPKWDGYRAIGDVSPTTVHLWSRNQNALEASYPAVAEALGKLGHDAIFDGEIVVLDAQGRSHFESLQSYRKTGKGRLVYHVFDLLYLDGHDLRKLSLRRRKEILATIVGKKGAVRLSEHIEQTGVAFFKAAAVHGLEGIVAKDAESRYAAGERSRSWLKIKVRQRQEAVIAGFTEPRRSRKHLGSLILGVYDGDDLVYIGHTGGGFGGQALADVHAKLEPLVHNKSPFRNPPRTNMPVHWVKPRLVCEVMFQEWTKAGVIRQPIFVGFRDDKPAREVRREVPVHANET